MPVKLVRIPTLKSAADFQGELRRLDCLIPCDLEMASGPNSPLAQPVPTLRVGGKQIGNRWAIQPMEGWDGTVEGGVTDEMTRRWQRFGESGAKLIFGGEAMAVRHDGRANPNQIVISEKMRPHLENLRRALVERHRELHGNSDDLVIGFQLTHSGRFSRPHDKRTLEPRIAYRHSILDRKFGIESDAPILSDLEIAALISDYVKAAKVASDVGADFVDIKHCHGYLLHEFLSARSRPGRYGGSFENRTRVLREIVEGIRASGNGIDVAVRLSAFDFVPFKRDPAPEAGGAGIPESLALPYMEGFGCDTQNPVAMDLSETHQFVALCHRLGIRLMNLSAGSPYYNPHIQRPAAYPPSDGYMPPEDPLVGVARQMNAVREVKSRAPAGMVFIGTGYSYLQEYLPHVAQAALRENWVDIIGLGRMALSYPGIMTDAVREQKTNPKLICRTFSDCTTAPRNGLISGCYPLDPFYKNRPEFQQLKEIKKQGRNA